ncbi:MAG TPA: carboxymuconolactone decarboxylase family protein [Paenibacillus sp.]|jgi:AhpD family alkylhydroperoxidase
MEIMNDKIKMYKNEMTHLEDNLPDVTKSYHEFTGQCFQEGALDAKTKQLIALGIGLFTNNEVCTFYHVQEARSKGATDAEIMETVAVVGAAGAGHAFAQGVTRVQKALH